MGAYLCDEGDGGVLAREGDHLRQEVCLLAQQHLHACHGVRLDVVALGVVAHGRDDESPLAVDVGSQAETALFVADRPLLRALQVEVHVGDRFARCFVQHVAYENHLTGIQREAACQTPDAQRQTLCAGG